MKIDKYFMQLRDYLNAIYGPLLVLRVAGVSLALSLPVMFVSIYLAFSMAGLALFIIWGFEYTYALQAQEEDDEV